MSAPNYPSTYDLNNGRDPARADAAQLADEQRAVATQLRQLIATPPTPPDYAEAGIDVAGEDASFARRLPDVQANLNKLRGQGMAERANEARGAVGSGFSTVARAAASPRFSQLQQWVVTALAAVGLILIIWGLVSTWLSSLTAPPAPPDASVAIAPAPPTLPPPATLRPQFTPTPAHGGRAAPQQLAIPALGSSNSGWQLLPVLPEQWRKVDASSNALFPTTSGELRQMGAYPGEPDNLIIVGGWAGFGEALQNLQLNDWLLIADRTGSQYLYIIIACDRINQRKECQSAKTDLTQLGHTTTATLTLVASRSANTNYIIRAVGGEPYSSR